VLFAAAPFAVGDVVGVASVDGLTAVPVEESASPAAETPGPAAPGPTVMVVAGAGAPAEVAGDGAIPVEAGGVPVADGEGEREVAGAVPDGVRIADVAVLGAALTVVVAVVAPVLDTVPELVPLVPVEVPM
jgi:hypothetical protein